MLTIHHLYKSRSERLLFLVCALDLPHRVIAYHRDPQTMLAPSAVTAIHPIGSCPVLEDATPSGKLMIAESGASALYLVDTYGQGRLLPPPGSAARQACLELVHFNEGTLMAWLVTLMMLIRAGAADAEAGRFVLSRIERYVEHLDRSLRDKPFLCGEDFSVADVMTAFTLDFLGNVTFPGLFQIKALEQATALAAYAARLRALPGYIYSQKLDF
ncbi:glutathione S-transferase [Rhodoblastus acidophilus]|uniref:glutathione S-transferase family protein n=1 Tax=Rhodoblastus acidophilus TaxID=1074 RepID=UPI002223F2B9|nr:glutathione S-transferase family protein [Rhodoblastus acidophilus]MCW2318564.1 glutathione S-transferase [Rhodoblastus acidophilus]